MACLDSDEHQTWCSAVRRRMPEPLRRDDAVSVDDGCTRGAACLGDERVYHVIYPHHLCMLCESNVRCILTRSAV